VTTPTRINPFLYLQANADANPSGLFSRSAHQSMTNAEAVVSVKKLAYELRRLGVKAGDIVALQLPEQLSILFTEAVFHEAAISTVLPAGYVADDVFQVDWIFSGGTPTPQRGAKIITVDSQFLQLVEQNPYGISPSHVPVDTLRIILSSGTTGTPNAVAVGRDTEIALDAALPGWLKSGPHLAMMDTSTLRGIGEFYLSVKGGQPFLCVGGAVPEAMVAVAAENSVRSLKGSPAQVASLVAELEARNQTLPQVETVFVSGGVLSPSLAARMRAVAEGCGVYSHYGSTEGGGATIRGYDSEDPFDAGHVVPGSQVEIVDEDDRVLPDGENGRVRVKSPGMVHGYLGNAEATERAFREGWFYPGDLGFIRADRGLTLTGRESELLNAGGVKIDPTRIDHFALRNPDVVDACSFGYTAKSGVTQIGLALVTKEGIDINALVADLAAEFGTGAPTLVARVDSIPKTAVGKPLRRTLAERYSES
jgi:long-chain acyl-CoA synthetase